MGASPCCALGTNDKREKLLIDIATKKREKQITKATPDDKYRKSSNTAFYKRQNENIKKSNYFIDPNSVKIEENKEFQAVLCDLCDAKNEEKQLKLVISRVIGDTIRVSVKEQRAEKNKKKRYEVNSNDDVLMNAARKPLSFSNVENTESSTILSWTTYSIKIFYQPFTVYIYESDQLQILINNGNKFYFEPYSNSNTPHSETALHYTYYHDYGPSSIGLDFDFLQLNENEKNINLYGIPSHSTSLSLPSTNTFDGNEAYRMYNLDVYKYELHSPQMLYGSIPYIINHNSVATNSILWCNSSETFVEINENSVDKYNSKNVRFMSETCALEAFILLHKNNKNKSYLSQYYLLTGSPQLPPLFSVGHHQCRWNYNDEKDVIDINNKFNEYNCPNDVIWLDIEHTDGKKYFTWDAVKFPNKEKRIMHNLSNNDTKRKLVCIVDPHIKKDESYYIYNEINKKDYWVKTRDNKNYEGNCWPGDSLYPDWINPKMRELWSKQFNVYNKDVFIWNDMNEPSVFNGPEGTMPCSNKHIDVIHHDLRHEEIHNLYGYYFHKASFEGLLNKLNDSNRRPFLLSRSFFIGSQKYGAIWTGDNTSNWKHLQISVPMLLSLSVAGMPFVGADIGGFFQTCTAKLMQRWYNLGMYYPFFRNHCHHNERRQEFWMFDDTDKKEYKKKFHNKKCMESMKNSIIERYKLLPYVYTLFYLSHCDGHPIMRPLWYEFQNDINTFDRDDAFMFGDALFVVPIVTCDVDKVSVVLPRKENVVYYELRNDDDEKCMVNVYEIEESKSENQRIVDLVDYKYSIPVLRIGGTLTIEKHKFVRRSSGLMENDPITIIIALDTKKYCSGKFYLDDGETLKHLDSKEYMLSEFIFDGDVFRNKLIHCDEKVNECNVYQIWILMSEANCISTKSVFVNSKQLESKKKLGVCYYKTPHLLVIDNVNVAVNYDFEIVFE